MTEHGERIVTLPDGQHLSLAWAAITDVGKRRELNEDTLVAIPPVFAVADGMGGHQAGEVASAAVAHRLTAATEHADVLTVEGLVEALRLAVADMIDQAEEGELGMGTTVTGLILTSDDGDSRLAVFNIGDSRVYRLLDTELVQVTEDHSIVQELIRAGAISPEEAEFHPNSNMITRAVGPSDDPIPDVELLPIESGARWLICSDGLTKELTDHGIWYFLTEGKTPVDAAELLVRAALDNGGRDNVSVVVLDVATVDSETAAAEAPAESPVEAATDVTAEVAAPSPAASPPVTEPNPGP